MMNLTGSKCFLRNADERVRAKEKGERAENRGFEFETNLIVVIGYGGILHVFSLYIVIIPISLAFSQFYRSDLWMYFMGKS